MLSRKLSDETIESINSFVDTLQPLVDTGVITTRQGYQAERIYRSATGGHTLRVYVYCDASYPAQSAYYVERWDGAQWHRVLGVPGEAFGNMPPKGADEERKQSALDSIEAELLHDAAAVIL